MSTIKRGQVRVDANGKTFVVLGREYGRDENGSVVSKIIVGGLQNNQVIEFDDSFVSSLVGQWQLNGSVRVSVLPGNGKFDVI